MASSYEFGPLLDSTSVVSVHRGSRLGARGFTRPVSLTVVRPDLVRERDFVKSFVDAAACFALVADPHVLTVDHVLDERGKLFAVSPEVNGSTLARLIDRPACRAKPVALGVACSIVRLIAGAVARVQKSLGGRALGGVSAETVWVTSGGDALLMPTAVSGAKVPARCRKLAVSRYRAPELDRASVVTPAADVYSLGLLLWDLVSHGRAPAGDLDAATRAVEREMDPRLVRLAMRCLSPSPGDRPQSAAAFRDELGAHAGAAAPREPAAGEGKYATTGDDDFPTIVREPRFETIEIRTDELLGASPAPVHDVAKAPVRRVSELARPPIPRPKPASGQAAGAPPLGPRLVGADGRRFRLEGNSGRWVIGRGQSADVVVLDPDVSREHFEVVRSPDGVFRAIDLSSKNGLFLNGSRARSFTLAPGDELIAGGTRLTFEI